MGQCDLWTGSIPEFPVARGSGAFVLAGARISGVVHVLEFDLTGWNPGKVMLQKSINSRFGLTCRLQSVLVCDHCGAALAGRGQLKSLETLVPDVHYFFWKEFLLRGTVFALGK